MQNMGDRSAGYWILGSVAAAFVAAAALAFSPMAGALLVGPVLALAIFTKRPKLGFLAWLLSVCAIPCWIGAAVGIFLPASLIGSVIALTCLFAGARRLPSKADLCVIVLLVASAFAVYFGSSSGASSASAFVSMFTLWLSGYLVGRFVCEKAGMSFVKTSVAVTFGAVGLLAIAEQTLFMAPLRFPVGSEITGRNLGADPDPRRRRAE